MRKQPIKVLIIFSLISQSSGKVFFLFILVSNKEDTIIFKRIAIEKEDDLRDIKDEMAVIS